MEQCLCDKHPQVAVSLRVSLDQTSSSPTLSEQMLQPHGGKIATLRFSVSLTPLGLLCVLSKHANRLYRLDVDVPELFVNALRL